MTEPETEQFLTHPAAERKVSPGTRNQALSRVMKKDRVVSPADIL